MKELIWNYTCWHCGAGSENGVWECRDCGNRDNSVMLLNDGCYACGSVKPPRPKCVACGKRMTRRGLDVTSVNIMLISGMAGGKTSMMTSMIEEITRSSDAIGWRLREADEGYAKTVQDVYTQTLYKAHCSLAASVVGGDWIASFIVDRKKGDPLVLNFFDFAQEDLMHEACRTEVNRAIRCAHLIVMLLDPENLNADVVEAMHARIGASTNIRYNGRIDIPTAVVLGKTDLIEGAAHEAGCTRMLESPAYGAAYDEEDGSKIHEEVLTLLGNKGRELDTLLRENFTRWRFFAASAYGAHDGKNPGENAAPRRVLDPLLWRLNMRRL